jgi:hypothetical protein
VRITRVVVFALLAGCGAPTYEQWSAEKQQQHLNRQALDERRQDWIDHFLEEGFTNDQAERKAYKMVPP